MYFSVVSSLMELSWPWIIAKWRIVLSFFCAFARESVDSENRDRGLLSRPIRFHLRFHSPFSVIFLIQFRHSSKLVQRERLAILRIVKLYGMRNCPSSVPRVYFLKWKLKRRQKFLAAIDIVKPFSSNAL